jgi:uncharacterized RDD family membrane protein YckC
LPPRPGRPQDSFTVWPKSTSARQRKFGLAIQFRACGGLLKVTAYVIDHFIVLGFFIAIRLALNGFINLFLRDQEHWQMPEENEWILTTAFWIFELMYYIFFITAFGRTIAMWFLAVLIVNRDGHRIQFWQIVLRTVLAPIDLFFFGWLIMFIRRDGKMWSDLGAKTVWVYAWNVAVIPKHHASLATSFDDFVRALPRKSAARKSFMTDSSISEKLVEYDYDDDEDSGDEDGDIEQQKQQQHRVRISDKVEQIEDQEQHQKRQD